MKAATPGCSAGFWPATWRWSPSTLPGDDAAATATRRTASELIASSADAAWANAAFDNDLPIFGPDWSRPAIRPGRSSAIAERDLSVQLSGWMLLEAAHAVAGAAD